jgi:hypothetical protein
MRKTTVKKTPKHLRKEKMSRQIKRTKQLTAAKLRFLRILKTPKVHQRLQTVTMMMMKMMMTTMMMKKMMMTMMMMKKMMMIVMLIKKKIKIKRPQRT